MRNQYIFILLFLVISVSGLGQTKEIDSLKRELLKTSLSDTTEIRLYMKIARAYLHYNNDSLGKYSDLTFKLSKSSTKYYFGRANNDRGMYFFGNDKLDSAKYYFKSAIEIGETEKDTPLLVNAYSNYAATLRDRTEFEENVKLNLKVIELSKSNKRQMGVTQYNLASTYSVAGFDSLTIKYLKLATANAEESNHDFLLAQTLPNLAFYALENNELDDMKMYLDKSLKICKKLKSPRVWSTYYMNVGHYYNKLKDFSKAEEAYIKALNESKRANYGYNIMYSYMALGVHFVLAQKPKKAIENFKEFEKMYNKNSVPSIGVDAYEYWAKAENMTGNFQNSNKYLEKYVKINDSLNSEKNKTSIANAETKYQTEKKDKEIAEQQLELADQQLAIQESKSKTRTMSILVVSLLLGSILLWFSFRQRQKRMQQQLVTIEKEQEVRTLESLMEGEEKERLRIAKELHDGVNGDLAAIKFKLTSLLETNNQVINEAVEMIDTSSEQVRAISHNLVPPSLRDFNLLKAVESYCENMNAIHEPEIIFQHLGDEIVLKKKQEANLFRIVQELVTNSIKHAEAKEIHVQLSNVENNLQLTVEDDGKGFDVANVKSDGIGMQNVKSRVEYLNGLMDVKSDGKGTSITITISDKLDNA
ncbi:sensor histidine kinase [Aurantibacter sp.]|uniref:tetratricopeptide repeat-containing sensor histidine kinase n=1 Tax=Aurantibacter sp. TaxID=2807103 RepID=UPI00326726BD